MNFDIVLLEGCWVAPVTYTSGRPELFPLNKTNPRNNLRGKVVVKVVKPLVKPLLSRIFLVAVTIEISASVFIHPFGDVRNTGTRQRAVLQGAAIPVPVLRTLGNSCLNCHSENTEWPWYSRLAPVSWLIERDVSRARSKMNLSRWEENSPEEKIAILTRMRAAARSKVMPPLQYTLIHPEAKLSATQIQELYAWAREEGGREREKGEKGDN
jgi:cytochrome c